MLFNRQTMFQDDENCRRLSLRYSKIEFIAVTILIVGEISLASAIVATSTIFKINEYQLPIFFYIIFLPFEGISLNWLLNLLFQILSMIAVSFAFSTYISSVMIMFDHTCWSMDILIILLQHFDDDQDENDTKIQQEQIRIRFKTAYEMHLNVLDWMDQVQKTIQFHFLMEFSIFSVLVCMCIYTVTDDPFSFAFINQLLVALLINFFVSLFMGTRVINKIEDLNNSVYSVKWYNYDVDNQKNVKKMLQACQEMKGYNGIFKPINMETFQQVWAYF